MTGMQFMEKEKESVTFNSNDFYDMIKKRTTVDFPEKVRKRMSENAAG